MVQLPSVSVGFGNACAAAVYNRSITAQVLPNFICPSNLTSILEPTWAGINPTVDGSYAKGTYAANNGGPFRDNNGVPLAGQDGAMTEYDDERALPLPRDGGVFSLNSNTRFSDFKNGTANTVMVAEIIAVGGQDMRGVMHYPEGPLYQWTHTPNDPAPDQLRRGNCVNDDPMAPCVGAYNAYSDRHFLMTSRSYHPGGVQVVMGDGSVHFCNQSIDLKLWQAISSLKEWPSGISFTGFE
jgi:prepilin-type processing-associated H-X9-DG protein